MIAVFDDAVDIADMDTFAAAAEDATMTFFAFLVMASVAETAGPKLKKPRLSMGPTVIRATSTSRRSRYMDGLLR